ncbi:MAG TPA: hypothetical protein VLI45_06390, partial [Acidobacteriaceae bacterium]|nr:hypothetical protein [Acidobacteriaceae bacterium]
MISVRHSRAVFPLFLSVCFIAACGMLAAEQSSRPHPTAASATAHASELFQAGSAAYAAGNLKEAHADFARLVRLVPQVAAAHSAFGAVLLAEGDASAAITQLNEAHRLAPDDGPTTINLALAYRAAHDPKQSAETFSAAERLPGVVLSPDEALAYATV